MQLTNNFSSGPDGANLTLANSGYEDDDAFDLISILAGGAFIQYESAVLLARPTAEFVLITATGSTASDNGVGWNTSAGSQSQIYWRQYIQITQLPVTSGMVGNMCIFECDNGAVYMSLVFVDDLTGKLFFNNDFSSPTVNVATTNVLPLNAWVRIECRIQFSTTTGNFELRLYLDPDSDTPTETISGSSLNLHAASANSYAFGSPFVVAHKPVTYFSGFEMNNTGWPGPAPYKMKAVPGIQPSAIAVHNDVF